MGNKSWVTQGSQLHPSLQPAPRSRAMLGAQVMGHSLAAIPKAYMSIVTQHRQGWVLGTAVTGSLRKVKVTAWQVAC